MNKEYTFNEIYKNYIYNMDIPDGLFIYLWAKMQYNLGGYKPMNLKNNRELKPLLKSDKQE
jgi:hypothetical protein